MTGYTCHRAERAAGFKHGNGVRKQRQEWFIGAHVNVGFIRGLLVVGGNEAGGWDLVGPNGRHYHFTPHLGLVRLGDVL